MTAPFAPSFLAPSQPGQLSNTRGSNLVADAILIKHRYANPKGANQMIQFARMQVYRTGVGGNPSSSQIASDSGWVGGIPTAQALTAPKTAAGGNSTVVYNGRLYMMPSDGKLLSSSVVSAAVGTWRYENPLPLSPFGVAPTAYSMTNVSRYLYCVATIGSSTSSAASLYSAVINGDGTVGAWQIVQGGIVVQNDTTWLNAGCMGGWDGISATGWVVIWKSGQTPFTYTVQIADGTITTAAVNAGGNPTVARDNLTAGVSGLASGAGIFYLIGGTASAASSVVDGCAFNLTTGAMTGAFTAKQALPAVRTGGTLIALVNGSVYYAGGSSTNVASGAVTTVYFNTFTGINTSVAWSTSANPIPTATFRAGGGFTMPDYNLSASATLADAITETWGGTGGSPMTQLVGAIASFKASGTPTLVKDGPIQYVTSIANLAALNITPQFGQATVAGHLLVCCLGGSDNAGSTISTASAGWVVAADAANFPTGAREAAVFYKPNCGAGEAAPTFTFNNASGPGIPHYAKLFEFSGVATVTPLDQTGTNGVSNNSQIQIAASAADAAVGDLVVSAGNGLFNGTPAFGSVTESDSGNNNMAPTSYTTPGGGITLGPATGVTATTLTLTGATWATNQWATWWVSMGGVQALVTSNNATVLTFTGGWSGATPGLGTFTMSNTLRVAGFAWAIAQSSILGLLPFLAIVGGQTVGASPVSSVIIAPTLTTHDVGPWLSGLGTAAVAGNFGTGGALVTNQDGTQDVTLAYGAIGQLNGASEGANYLGTLNDGDILTIAMQTVGTDGDPSPISYTVVKIGQPPSITGVAPAGATSDGRPSISFSYIPGAGGDLEFSYRVQVAPNGFDSGIRYDGANLIQLLTAPYLPSTTQQTITITVVSRDSPMPGSSNQAVATILFTPTITSPGTPSGLTATPNHALGLIALAWTNNGPAGTTPGNRVYYRRNGTSTWFLLADLSSASTSYNAMDQIALSVAYDFAVSQVDNNNHSESALSNIASNVTISPVTGGYSGFFHIQGQGTTHFAPLLVQGSPDVSAEFDTTATLPFQQLTPTVTLGVAHYAKLEIPVLVPTLANQKQIMDILATAYLGNSIVYRDGFGGMATFQMDPEQTESYLPPVARISTFKMTQIANQFQPSTQLGVATGYLQQVFNSIQPLDPSEAFL